MTLETMRDRCASWRRFAKAASVKLAQATTEERNGALLAMAAALRAQAAGHRGGQRRATWRRPAAAGTTEALLEPAHAGRGPRLSHGRRFGGGGGAARSARRRVAGIDPLDNGIAASARVGAPRRGGHGLRGPAQRDRRRCRGLREVRQRVHPAGRQPCGRARTRPSPTCWPRLPWKRGCREGSICAVDHHRPGGHRCAHGAARPGGRAHSPRWRGPYPPLRGACQGAGHRDGHGQLPRVRARVRRPRRWPAPSCKNAKCRRYGVCNAAETLLVDAVGGRCGAAAHSRGHEGGRRARPRR